MGNNFMRQSMQKDSTLGVNDKTVVKLLRAAMVAPLAENDQPWEFIVTRDRAALEEIIKIHEYYQMLKDISTAIIICADPKRSKYPDGYWIQDCAVATQNILLAAASTGLAACWLGIYPQPERVDALRRIFDVPDDIVPFAVIALGYLTGEQRSADRSDEVRLRHETWKSIITIKEEKDEYSSSDEANTRSTTG